MADTASEVTRKVVSILRAPTGLSAAAADVEERSGEAVAVIPADQVVPRNASAEVNERSTVAKYPAVSVYCERVVNSLREKFQTFSGQVHMVAEIRVTQDRIETIERQLQLQADVLTQTLDSQRGDWGNGMFYTGGYEIAFGPVRHGGKNFLQQAKVTFAVELSK